MDKNNNARYLRNNMTEQEKKLWYFLKNKQINNCRFRRQHPVGKYIADFVCREKNLIIELDGGQHNEPKNIICDKERTKYLESNGFHVIRFWNTDIDENIDEVLNIIKQNLL